MKELSPGKEHSPEAVDLPEMRRVSDLFPTMPACLTPPPQAARIQVNTVVLSGVAKLSPPKGTLTAHSPTHGLHQRRTHFSASLCMLPPQVFVCNRKEDRVHLDLDSGLLCRQQTVCTRIPLLVRGIYCSWNLSPSNGGRGGARL